jgi:hypothetical protein
MYGEEERLSDYTQLSGSLFQVEGRFCLIHCTIVAIKLPIRLTDVLAAGRETGDDCKCAAIRRLLGFPGCYEPY